MTNIRSFLKSLLVKNTFISELGELHKLKTELGVELQKGKIFDQKEILEALVKLKILREHHGILVVWDPEVLSAQEYAELIKALGDLVRSEGGRGVGRVISQSIGVPAGEGVPA